MAAGCRESIDPVVTRGSEMRVSFRRFRTAATASLVAISFAACTNAAAPTAAPSRSTATASPHPAATPAPIPTLGGIPAATLLLRTTGSPDWQLVDASTGTAVFAFPVGTPSDDWHRLVTATRANPD